MPFAINARPSSTSSSPRRYTRDRIKAPWMRHEPAPDAFDVPSQGGRFGNDGPEDLEDRAVQAHRSSITGDSTRTRDSVTTIDNNKEQTPTCALPKSHSAF